MQTICQEILDGMHKGADFSSLQKWIDDEQRNLRKKQTSLWGPTVSDFSYYHYLTTLHDAIKQNQEGEYFQKVYSEIAKITRKKIYALFLTEDVSCWPSLESVFWAAHQNFDYETALVYVPFFHQNFINQADYFDEYLGMGVPVIRHNEYNIADHSPDILFMNKPYSSVPEQYQVKHLECVIPRIIYIPYGMEVTTDLAKFGFQYYLQYRAWRHCVYGDIVKKFAKRYGYRDGENIAVWGHPKADIYQNIEKKREKIPEKWKQIIKGRKTILWTPHHLINLNGSGTGTWLLWGKKILDLALNSPDIVFIFRPHPLMFGALINGGHMTRSQVDRLQQRILNAENIIWDTNSLYYDAFYAADAIITDGTTFSIEFLYTKKPIMLTPRNMEGFYMYEEMLQSYYIGHEMSDIARFVQMIALGDDPLQDARMALYQKMFFIPKDGTVGEYIVEHTKQDLVEECHKRPCGELPSSKDKKEDISQTIIDEESEFPLFSIVVLCYKNTDLLYAMLDSIFRQDYPRIQLIVSDDCSEDFDIDTVQTYINVHKRHNIEQVVVKKNEQNLRTVKHISRALSFAKGDYIVFTAADDRFADSDIISHYVELFLKSPDSVWLVAQCQVTTADYKKTIYVTPTKADEPCFSKKDAQALFSRWSRRSIAVPCSMAFRKEAFDIVGGIDLKYQLIEDWPLVLKLLRSGFAPIYCDIVVAIHSSGGVTNSNARYGKELRKCLYDDKYLLFKNEVAPYIELLTHEDRKAYKQYLREIMARHYFFYIDWPETTTLQRVGLCLKRPIRFWWVFEQKYMKHKDKIHRKKLFVSAHGLFLFSFLFLNIQIYNNAFILNIFQSIGWLDLIAAGLLLFISIATFPLEKYFCYKAHLRAKLVN